MRAPPIISNEHERVAALKRLGVLDTPPEERFDRITRLASSVFNCNFASITLIDENRQWFKSVVNLDMAETTRDVAFCAHTIAQDKTLIVPDTLNDPRFNNNPYVVGHPQIRFYAGVRLMVEGFPVGTLCVLFWSI